MPVPLVASTAERQTLEEIRDWRTGIIEALIEQRAAVQLSISQGFPVGGRFTGMTEAELDQYYDVHRRELDRLTTLNLVASTEASVTDDYFHRVRRQLKDPLSRAYRDWHKRLSTRDQLRPPFSGKGILSVLRMSTGEAASIMQFQRCLQSRHWVGHGRRWDKPIAIEQFDPDEVFNRATALLAIIPPI